MRLQFLRLLLLVAHGKPEEGGEAEKERKLAEEQEPIDSDHDSTLGRVGLVASLVFSTLKWILQLVTTAALIA